MDLSQTKRRIFIKQTAKVAGGMALLPLLPGCLGASEKQSKQDYPIIDTHQHLWDRRFNLTWPKPPINEGDFMLPEYRLDIEGLNFVKSLYIDVGVPKEKRREEALFALGIAADTSNNTVGASIRATPSEDNFKDFVGEFANNPHLIGVRGSLKNLYEFLSETVTDNLRWMGEKGLLYDVMVPVKWLSKVIPQIDKCAGTTFILNHCGLVDPVALFPEDLQKPREAKHSAELWRSGMKAIAAKENVICKISGIVDAFRDFDLEAKHLAPAVNYCLDTFGPDRVVFATDWPVCRVYSKSIKGWVGLLKEIVKDRPIEEQKKLFHDNAERIYKV